MLDLLRMILYPLCSCYAFSLACHYHELVRTHKRWVSGGKGRRDLWICRIVSGIFWLVAVALVVEFMALVEPLK